MTLASSDQDCCQVAEGTVVDYLEKYIESRGFQRIFLVTGRKSFEWFSSRGFVPTLASQASVQHWSGVNPNPTFENLLEGIRRCRAFRPDLVLGVGGGSVIDMSKLVAALLGSEFSDLDCALAQNLDERETELVVVPTTAGSGAEATNFSVLYRDGVKLSISGESLLADHVVLDPALVRSGTRNQLAASGLDALCQCIESIWAKGKTPESQSYAVDGLRLVSHNLVSFVNGDFSKASAMQWGAYQAGRAIRISKTTAPHAFSYYLTTERDVPHGIGVAATVGYFIDYHWQILGASSGDDLTQLAKDMAVVYEILGLSADASSGRNYFEKLFRDLGLGGPEDFWPKEIGDLNKWLDSANPSRMENHPLELARGAWMAGGYRIQEFGPEEAP